MLWVVMVLSQYTPTLCPSEMLSISCCIKFKKSVTSCAMVSFHHVSVAQPFSTLVLGRLIMSCSVTCLLIAHLDKLCLIYLPAPASLPGCTALNHCSRPDTISQRIFHNLTNQTPIYDLTNPKSSLEIFLFISSIIASLLGTRVK